MRKWASSMNILGFITAVATLAFPVGSAAKATQPDIMKTGKTFISACQNPSDESRAEECLAYAGAIGAAVSAANGVTRDLGLTSEQDICLPDLPQDASETQIWESEKQLLEIGLKFIRTNPELESHEAADLLIVSWRQVFPCPAGKTL